MLLVVSLLVAFTLGFQGPAAESGEVVFSAMGCGPYSPEAEAALSAYIERDNRQDRKRSEFMVHLGDIFSGVFPARDDTQYAKVAAILKTGNEIPTFVLPGDNEWNDQRDPDLNWTFWERHFLHFEKAFDFASEVAHQAGRPENFAFVLKGVLFIGINKVGGRVHDAEEWSRRLADDARWVSKNLSSWKKHARAAIVFAQASPAGFDDQFLDPFRTAAAEFEKPILYLHADGHKWFVKEGSFQPNIVQVQLDVVDASFPSVQITVTADLGQPFKFDRRLEWASVPGHEDKQKVKNDQE